MSRDISVSDDYVWASSTGMYDWVMGYLKERIPEPELWEFVDRQGYFVLHDFFVSRLPEPYRRRVLRLLADEVPQAYAASLTPAGSAAKELVLREAEQIIVQHAVDQLDILAMMAREVGSRLYRGRKA